MSSVQKNVSAPWSRHPGVLQSSGVPIQAGFIENEGGNESESESEAQFRRKRRLNGTVVRKSWIVALPRCISAATVGTYAARCVPRKSSQNFGPARLGGGAQAELRDRTTRRRVSKELIWRQGHTARKLVWATLSLLTLGGAAAGQFGGDFQSTIRQKPLPHIGAAPSGFDDRGTRQGQHRATTPCPFSTPAAMDITKFVVSLREKALLYGDYSTYWSQLSGKLLNCRKKLNIATKSRAKFNPKAPVTPEQIAENHECV